MHMTGKRGQSYPSPQAPDVLFERGEHHGSGALETTGESCPPSWLPALLDRLVDELTRHVVGPNVRPDGATTMPHTEINGEILDHVVQRGITRLVHFTRTEALKKIVEDQEIASAWRLRSRNRTVVINDPKRLDGHPDHVCCSVEYPNVYVLDRYGQERPGQEWVILFLHTILLGLPTTRFSPVNAATGRGAYVQNGIDGFRSLFDERVALRREVRRASCHLKNCPTDVQAEVLVEGAVPTGLVTGAAVKSDAVAGEIEPLLHNWPSANPRPDRPDRPPLSVEPLLFDKDELLRTIRGYRY